MPRESRYRLDSLAMMTLAHLLTMTKDCKSIATTRDYHAKQATLAIYKKDNFNRTT